MYAEKIKTIVLSSATVEDALKRIVLELGQGRLKHLAWGFAVHAHGVARNDAITAHTFDSQEVNDAFHAVGGTSTDVVATQLHALSDPFQIDVVQLAEHQRNEGDGRLKFTETLLAHGLNMAWICPIVQPWSGGSGVFNQFYTDRKAKPVIPNELISEVAHIFHDEIKRRGLIAKEINLRDSQVELLSEVAKGRSAEDLAEKYQVSNRAVEKRLETIRKALKSRNTLEAVYKAAMYGVLPYSSREH